MSRRPLATLPSPFAPPYNQALPAPPKGGRPVELPVMVEPLANNGYRAIGACVLSIARNCPSLLSPSPCARARVPVERTANKPSRFHYLRRRAQVLKGA